MTGISFLNEELHLPVGNNISEHLASLYRDTIIKGNAMYETINLPDYQFNLSIADLISQIYLPIKNPRPYKGFMIDNQALCSFDVIIAEACSRPGLKCFVFILNPDHSLCICMNETTIAVFDSHRFSSCFGALVIFSSVADIGKFLPVFLERMKGCGCTVIGANFSEIELDKN